MGFKSACIVFALAAISFTGPGAQAAPPPEVVAEAIDLYFGDYDYSDPEDAAYAPRPAPNQADIWLRQKVLRTVNLTGGAKPDWMIDVERAPSGSLCGTGGCPLQIWAADDSGSYRQIFADQIGFYKLKPIKGEKHQWLEVNLHGTACGSFGADPCAYGFEWSPQNRIITGSFRFTKTPVVRPAPLPQGHYWDETQADITPPDLIAFLRQQQQICVAQGGVYDGQAVINRTPDLNGDGIADWSLDATMAYCYRVEPVTEDTSDDDCNRLACVNRLYLSRREDDRVTWHEGPELGTTPYGYELHPNGTVRVVKVVANEKATDDNPYGCDTFTLRDCQLETLNLSPSL
ncbi:hypothetical protein [Asticcacaulis tiandongensis]|uniref:hypothetical protein n=1 Tax=Asticcacaulis tiandongensis TaxID=2565365 RepID=UPI00112E0F58|nr:hypothetical protein [Asticcacaulis tiandongensis]